MAVYSAESHPELPTGTVTFLFTDVVGSTKLWQEYPDAMPAVIAQHDDMLGGTVDDHGGIVFRTAGDAVYAAFRRPVDALRAAVSGQRSILSADWGPVGSLHVRMALHTGQADVREGIYVGHTLNRVARILSAVHGDQIVVSEAVQELVRDHVLDGIELQDLGEFRLKDLVAPEHLWQAVAPDLPREFPPLVARGSRPAGIPVEPTRFIGRDREVAALADLVRQDDMRLVTLTGPGGIGKTRLAAEVVRAVASDFPDGVFVAPLGSTTDANMVPSQIAAALGLRETGGQPVLGLVEAYLKDRALLLILDNFEQVLGARMSVASLIASSPGLKMVVTSRQVLHLSGEHEYPVPALSVPPAADSDPAAPKIENLMTYEAIALFFDRARNVLPAFALTPTNAPAVIEISRRLDGLPLAIELAAARVRLFPPEALLRRLDHRLQFLTGGAADRPSRQQTLRAAIDWSYQLLAEPERAVLARLSVFSEGCDLEAAETVCGLDDGSDDVLGPLEALLDHSLIQRQDSTSGEPRVVLLDTLREYANERLEERGEAETLRERHASYFADLVLAAERREDVPRRDRVRRYDEERGNIRSAIAWCRRHRPGTGLILGRALWMYWFMRGEMDQLHAWFDDVDAQADQLTELELAEIVSTAALAAEVLHDPRVDRWFDRSMALREQIGDPARHIDWLLRSGTVALREGRTAEAVSLLVEALKALNSDQEPDRVRWGRYELAIAAEALGDYDLVDGVARDGVADARRNNDTHEVARWTWWLGREALLRGDLDHAQALLEQSLATREQLADQYCTSESVFSLAALALARGDLEQARSIAERNLDLVRRLQDYERVAWHHSLLGSEALLRGDLDAARDTFRTGIDVALQMPVSAAMFYVLADQMWGTAGIAAAQGDVVQAARLSGQALGLLGAAGRRPAPIEQARYDKYLEPVRDGPAAADFRETQRENEQIAPEEIVRLLRRR